MRAFADALDCVPMALAQNSGLSPIETLASIKSRQVKEKNTRLGVDCMQTGSSGEFIRFWILYVSLPTICPAMLYRVHPVASAERSQSVQWLHKSGVFVASSKHGISFGFECCQLEINMDSVLANLRNRVASDSSLSTPS